MEKEKFVSPFPFSSRSPSLLLHLFFSPPLLLPPSSFLSLSTPSFTIPPSPYISLLLALRTIRTS